MSTDTSPSASEIAATLTTACVHAWQAMGRQGALNPTNAMHSAYAECQAAIKSAGPGLHLRCAEASAEIARLQAQVDALRHEVSERRVVLSAQLDVIDALAGALGDAMAQIRISPVLAGHPETAEVLSRGAAALAAIGR